MARPTKYTEETAKKITDAIRVGATYAPSDDSLMDSIGQLMEGAAKRPRRSARVPEELTRDE